MTLLLHLLAAAPPPDPEGLTAGWALGIAGTVIAGLLGLAASLFWKLRAAEKAVDRVYDDGLRERLEHITKRLDSLEHFRTHESQENLRQMRQELRSDFLALGDRLQGLTDAFTEQMRNLEMRVADLMSRREHDPTGFGRQPSRPGGG